MSVVRRTAKFVLLAAGFVITLGTAALVAFGLAYVAAGVSAETVEKYLSEQIRRPVQVDAIQTRWRGWHAEIEAKGIRIMRRDGTRLALRLRKLEIAVNPLTVLSAEPGLESIVVHGLKLRVVRREDGTIRVGDIVSEPKSTPSPALEWLLRQPSSEIRDGSLTWVDRLDSNRVLVIRDINIAMHNIGGALRFGGEATPPPALGDTISIGGEIQGQLLRSGLWDGHVEFDAPRLELDAMPLVVTDVLPWRTDGTLSARIDSEWLDGHVIEAVGRMSLSDFEIPFEGGDKTIPVRGFVADVAWRHNQKDWRLEFVGPEIDVNGSVLRAGRLAVGLTRDTRTYHVDRLDVAEVVAVRDRLGFDLPWHEVTRHVEPDGWLQDISVVARGPFLSPRHWRAEAGFQGIGWRSFSGIPGVTGARGRLGVAPDGGSVVLDASGVSVDAPDLLAESIYLNRLEGEIGWSRDRGQWIIDVSDLEVENSDIQALRGRMRLRIPDRGSGMPQIDSEFTVTEVEVGKLKRYIPLGKMPAKPAAWLDSALQQGSFRDARIDLVGDLGRFPFRSGGGSFYVSSKVLDGRLRYADRWPDADEIFGYFSLNNAALHADVASAEIGGARVIDAVVESRDLFSRDAEVAVRARLASPAAAVVDFLTDGPLVRNRDGDSPKLQAAGSGTLTLDVLLPLRDLAEGARVSGSYEFDNAELTVADRFDFKGLKGAVAFTDSTVAARGIAGVLMGGPLTMDIDTLTPGRPPVWRIDARGRAEATALASLLDNAAASDNVSGETAWSGSLTVDGASAELDVGSSLEGVDVALPEPLKKSAEQARPTTVRARLGRKDRQYRFSSGPLEGVLVYDRIGGRSVVRSGVVSIGGTDAGRPPPAAGVRVEIRQPFLNLDEWLRLSQPEVEGPPPSQDAVWAALRSVELQLDEVRFLSRNLGKTRVRAGSRDGRDWEAWLSGDTVSGRLAAHVSDEGPNAYVMNFDRLYLPKPRGKPRPIDTESQRRYPDVRIHADHFIFGEWDLGRLDLKATSYVGRWSVDEFVVEQPGLQVSANGHWAYGQGGSTTRIRASMHSDDIAVALARLSLPPHIADARARLDVALEWPGHPQGFALGSMSGTYSATAEAGRFLNVDPGSGRLLGLFNIAAISRRLSLDFTDIFSKGLAFDHIKAEGTIMEGNLHSDGMFIAGPSALIEIGGRTGLVDEDYDLRVVVAPHVGSQISMISALANPVAGAMMFIAQKVFEKQLSKMIQYQYDITGSWDAPEFKTVRFEPEIAEEVVR